MEIPTMGFSLYLIRIRFFWVFRVVLKLGVTINWIEFSCHLQRVNDYNKFFSPFATSLAHLTRVFILFSAFIQLCGLACLTGWWRGGTSLKKARDSTVIRGCRARKKGGRSHSSDQHRDHLRALRRVRLNSQLPLPSANPFQLKIYSSTTLYIEIDMTHANSKWLDLMITSHVAEKLCNFLIMPRNSIATRQSTSRTSIPFSRKNNFQLLPIESYSSCHE